MTTLHFSSRIALIPLLLIILTACRGSEPTSPPSPTLPAGLPSPSPAPVEPEPIPVATEPAATGPFRGMGDYDLPHLALPSRLESYAASIEVTTKGSQSGVPYEVSTLLESQVNHVQDAELSSLLSSGQYGETLQLNYAVFGESVYLVSAGQDQCNLLGEDEAQAGLGIEAMLGAFPGVYGAQRAGVDTLDGRPVIRYTFDERTVTREQGVSASGELWIAEADGLVLKYELALSASQTEQTWRYQLSQINTLPHLKLPAFCPPSLADLPVLPGATSLVRLPGFMSYTTQSKPDDAIAFSREQLAARGWTEQPGPVPAEDTVLFFTYGEPHQKVAMLTLSPEQDGQRVQVQIIQQE